MPGFPYIVAVLSIVALWLLGGLLAGAWNPWKFIEGADGRPSTSKLQWLLWIGVSFFSYVTLATARRSLTDMGLPENMLLCLGFSTGTMAAAKGLTVSQINSGSISKRSANGGVPLQASLSHLLTDDSGAPDLSKLQMLAWTLLALVSYVTAVVGLVNGGHIAAATKMPDIDATLMALMGIGQGGYLGKKMTTSGTDAASRDPFALLR